MRASGFTDPSFARLAELAHLLAGLVFPPNRQPSAEAGMRRAMAALRISDPAELLRAAEAPGPARDVVLAELTVGESYFFRDAAQFGILGSEILPTRLESEDAARPLRIWSAGCASGEEPYTVAIMLRELAWPHPARILGTDVAMPRLEAARRGRYTRWALRGVSEDRVARWFRRTGNQFELDHQIRESVDFRPLNLVHDDYSSATAGAGGFDLLLCRNVMIYFDLPTVTRIATGLLDSLDPNGWLVLGASDPPLAQLVPCEVVLTPGGVAYRRADRAGAPLRTRIAYTVADRVSVLDAQSALVPTAKIGASVVPAPVVGRIEPGPTAVLPRDLADDGAIRTAYEQADYPAAEELASVALASASDSKDTLRLWILYIRAVANQGRLHEAGELCARAIQTHPLAPELHYLHGTLLAEAGWQADAAIAARRSIYLDRKFVMAHLLLGDALARTGHPKGARIAFENAVALLADADATPIPAADGVPATRLRQIATLHLRELTEAKPR
jgi:chemotaxis protein methyltransferase CheR